ncbi:MAG TPA: acetyl-CoA C-acyltransferase, partial [Candidatus Dormibacteraeota bacterium]
GAPYLLPSARWGARLGNGEIVDAVVHDGLWSTFTGQHMGESSDTVNRELEISREDQDAWAARSHQRAQHAWEAGHFDQEVVTVEVAARKGSPTVVARDEGVRGQTTVEALAALAPAFGEDGTITAGNASQLSEAAAALVVMSPARAEALGARPLAEIVAHGMSADRFAYLHTVPALALEHALHKAELRPRDLDLLEINEAFASVALNSTRMLGVDEERVNVNGGAVALGHPIGATGARLVVTLLAELRRRGMTVGAATLCGGGGQGDALVIRAVA